MIYKFLIILSGFAIIAYTKEYYNMVGNVELNVVQTKWLKFYKTLVDLPPPFLYSRPIAATILSRSTNPLLVWLRDIDLALRRFAFHIVIRPWFEQLSFVVILINVLAMSLSYYDQVCRHLNFIEFIVSHICMI